MRIILNNSDISIYYNIIFYQINLCQCQIVLAYYNIFRVFPGCSFQMVKIYSVFHDIDQGSIQISHYLTDTPNQIDYFSTETLYDVLHDPDYRKIWDTHMVESIEIGLLNVNNDVGYYASKFNLQTPTTSVTLPTKTLLYFQCHVHLL